MVSLSPHEGAWAEYLNAQPDTPEGFIGDLLLPALAWSSEMEHQATSERTKRGLDKARAAGKRMGRPPALKPAQVSLAKRQAAAGMTRRQIADVLEVSLSTVERALREPDAQR